jgi:glycosyltransferase involved in cell wall biosynthesis
MRIAVIVTTYNRPDALAAVLDGYCAQDCRRFEVLVADDGSRGDTRSLVSEYARRAPFPLRHVWQEDRGFRAGAVRNRALARTTAEYVVFTDGDCIPMPSFVRRHAELAEPGFFVAGNRILLSARFTSKVLEDHVPIHAWPTGRWLAAWMRGDVNRALPLLSLPDGGFRKRRSERWEGVKTCNLGAWREDLVRANGFDETYSGWGLEDSDLVVRLLHAGVRHKSGRFAVPVLHLWHTENDRSALPENRRRLDDILASDRVAARLGLDRYQREDAGACGRSESHAT